MSVELTVSNVNHLRYGESFHLSKSPAGFFQQAEPYTLVSITGLCINVHISDLTDMFDHEELTLALLTL